MIYGKEVLSRFTRKKEDSDGTRAFSILLSIIHPKDKTKRRFQLHGVLVICIILPLILAFTSTQWRVLVFIWKFKNDPKCTTDCAYLSTTVRYEYGLMNTKWVPLRPAKHELFNNLFTPFVLETNSSDEAAGDSGDMKMVLRYITFTEIIEKLVSGEKIHIRTRASYFMPGNSKILEIRYKAGSLVDEYRKNMKEKFGDLANADSFLRSEVFIRKEVLSDELLRVPWNDNKMLTLVSMALICASSVAYSLVKECYSSETDYLKLRKRAARQLELRRRKKRIYAYKEPDSVQVKQVSEAKFRVLVCFLGMVICLWTIVLNYAAVTMMMRRVNQFAFQTKHFHYFPAHPSGLMTAYTRMLVAALLFMIGLSVNLRTLNTITPYSEREFEFRSWNNNGGQIWHEINEPWYQTWRRWQRQGTAS